MKEEAAVHNRAHYVAGCREPECRAANAQYIAEYRKSRAPEKPPVDPWVRFGGEPRVTVGVSGETAEVVGRCIPWRGYLNPTGYGQLYYGGRTQLAHRVAYEHAIGPIPDGLTVDHMCYEPSCVNVDHLRLLTLADNTRARRITLRTQCRHGHWLTPENTYFVPNGGSRNCRTCIAAAARRFKERSTR